MTKKKKARRQRQRAANTAKQDPEGLQHHRQQAANTTEELDSLHHQAGRFSLDDACHHGLDLAAGPRMTLFLKLLRAICEEWFNDDFNSDVFDNQYCHFHDVFRRIQSECESGMLCHIKLCAHDIRVMIQAFISWGVEYLPKSALSPDIYQTMACSMGMLVHVVSTYFAESHGKSFQSYFISLEFDEILSNDNNYLFFIGRFAFTAAKLFSPQVTCSCIPTYMSCGHGFSAAPDDPIYSFIDSYKDATSEAIKITKGEINLARVHEFIQKKMIESGVSHWMLYGRLKMRTLSFLTAFATDLFLGGFDEYALTVVFIKHIEELQRLDEPHESWVKRQAEFTRFVADLAADTKRKSAKFLSSRLKECSCLKEVCKELKHDAKKGRCANCFEIKDRTELKTCQQCTSLDYCSRSCQVAHWPYHKHDCREIVEARKGKSCWRTIAQQPICKEFVDAVFYEQKLQSDNDA